MSHQIYENLVGSQIKNLKTQTVQWNDLIRALAGWIGW